MRKINGQTAIYGIIGHPVAHSLSPLFQNYFMEHGQRNAVYLPFPVDPAHVDVALEGLLRAGIQGLNVTVPHKESVLLQVQADADAQLIGAVNTLKAAANGWLATNTDWLGFAAVLQGLQAQVSQQPVLLFGAGGTSRAICHALYQEGARQVWICNRSRERAENLAQHVQKTYADFDCELIAWDEGVVSKAVLDCAVLINSTSIGLGDDDVFPFAFSGQGVAVDAVYKADGSTAFTRAAQAGGFVAVDGLPMLIAQGIASFAFWQQGSQVTPKLDSPKQLQSLQWVEQALGRENLALPGWGE